MAKIALYDKDGNYYYGKLKDGGKIDESRPGRCRDHGLSLTE